MGDVNQVAFIEKHRGRLTGPVLEIGSRDYGRTPDLRKLFPQHEYLGVDMSAGVGVDVVCDFTQPLDEIVKTIGRSELGTVVMLSVLEHCDQPFALASNVSELLAPGGHLVISVPFVWMVHGYPDDYWRFTPSGVRKLFPRLSFEAPWMSTGRAGTLELADEQVGRVDLANGLRWAMTQGPRWAMTTLARKVGGMPTAFSEPYLYPATMIHMLGRKTS